MSAMATNTTLRRFVHTRCSYMFGELHELAPDIVVNSEGRVYGLAFTDPDGECHIFMLDESGKQGLQAQMTSGIVLPGNGRPH